MLMNLFRGLLICLCHILPPKLGRIAARLCNDYVSPYPDERGCYRTDVAFCAIGLLRQGDVEGFRIYLGKYPFVERWQGFFHPRLFYISFFNGEWRITTVRIPRPYGKALIQPMNCQN